MILIVLIMTTMDFVLNRLEDSHKILHSAAACKQITKVSSLMWETFSKQAAHQEVLLQEVEHLHKYWDLEDILLLKDGSESFQQSDYTINEFHNMMLMEKLEHVMMDTHFWMGSVWLWAVIALNIPAQMDYVLDAVLLTIWESVKYALHPRHQFVSSQLQPESHALNVHLHMFLSTDNATGKDSMLLTFHHPTQLK